MNHFVTFNHEIYYRRTGNYDEYAGLMNNRERQWLLNIQIIQLATDKPHVDDYYYMVNYFFALLPNKVKNTQSY